MIPYGAADGVKLGMISQRMMNIMKTHSKLHNLKWDKTLWKPSLIFMYSVFRDSNHSHEESENYIITGGLDDLIKVWQLENGKLELRHKMEGHSLGVISVAVSPDGKSE